MKTITVNRRNILITSAIALMLIALGTGLSSPETKTETRTRTVTEQVKGDTKYELSPICKLALVDSTQTIIDLNYIIVDFATAASNLDSIALRGVLEKQKVVNEKMVIASKQTAQCDPSIASLIDFGK